MVAPATSVADHPEFQVLHAADRRKVCHRADDQASNPQRFDLFDFWMSKGCSSGLPTGR
ncbi:hypothetical protein ACCAA_10020 [Candidatus Accumulibacter aalborgensis]|uniref:Uncharacterized protein n=1 Tax=Candidatus Accumulibacter aalborgensis TaxID=1860102 RepID=A0A1A8XFC0_9PROT|nr:hypothetical protein ACCAA_10020 [Candidatus Accumulibacter aalborgensis]